MVGVVPRRGAAEQRSLTQPDLLAEHVAAARDGARGVERGRPGRRRRGALHPGGAPAAAAVRRPRRLRTPLLPVQLAEYVTR